MLAAMRSDRDRESRRATAHPAREPTMTRSGGLALPAGPGRALVMAVDNGLRTQLGDAGWQVSAVPMPSGDLTGFGLAASAGSADLVVVQDALSPLHHADKRAALGVALKWLRPGGSLLLREPLEPTWAGRRGRLHGAVQRLLHGRLDPHYGPASVPFWGDACRDAGFEQIDIADSAGAMTLRATRRMNGPADPEPARPFGQ